MRLTKDTLLKQFNIDSFLNIQKRDSDSVFSQEDVIRSIMKGKDVLAVITTGGGKSLCYQIPAMLLPGVTIVVSPLLALMKDQEQSMRKLVKERVRGERPLAVSINSECTGARRRMIFHEIIQERDKEEKQYKMILISPEILTSPEFVNFAKKIEISLLVIDEAHCVSLWGYQFRPEYMRISRFQRMVGQKFPTAAFTATASNYVIQDMKQILGLKNPVEYIGSVERENLDLSILYRAKEKDKLAAFFGLMEIHNEENVIVYCNTKETINKLCGALQDKYGVTKVVRFYGTMSQEEKARNGEAFLQGTDKILVATNAFGMGIDKADVRCIIHYDMPDSMEHYYQEIGRAGRDGKPASCFLLYSEEDKERINYDYEKQKILLGESSAKLQNQLARWRRDQMLVYVRKWNRKTSAELQKYIADYFKNDGFLKKVINKNIEQSEINRVIGQLDCIYANKTKLANIIRRGEYQIQSMESKDVNRISYGKISFGFKLDTRLDYFDMMIADAVYTLYLSGTESFHIRQIMRLLTGKYDVMVKKDRGEDIKRRLLKMKKAQIWIDMEHVKREADEENNFKDTALTGAFLPLENVGKTGYRLVKTPPLYEYAGQMNSQFFVIPTIDLGGYYTKEIDKMDSGKCSDAAKEKPENSTRNENVKKKLPIEKHTIENMELRYYIAYRIQLCNQRQRMKEDSTERETLVVNNHMRLRYYERGAAEKKIALKAESEKYGEEPSRYLRLGMLEVLDICWPEGIYDQNRKEKEILIKIERILKYHKKLGNIVGYQMPETKEDPSVELFFY